MVAAVERATAHFAEQGRSIAQENPEIEPEMLQAVDEVIKTGEVMSSAAREFASDPCSSVRRGNMVKLCFLTFSKLYSNPNSDYFLFIQSNHFFRFVPPETYCPP